LDLAGNLLTVLDLGDLDFVLDLYLVVY